MARAIHTRLMITGQLVAQTPLHVGGYGNHPDTDLPLAQNGQGDFYVPGTSIAGVLRNWCALQFPHSTLMADLFGPQHSKGAAEGFASFVRIEDATLQDDALPEIRDGVGIDRSSGTAADKIKFDRAILPRGTTLNFAMAVEIESQRKPNPEGKTEAEKRGETQQEFQQRKNQTRVILGHLLTSLQSAQLRFGGAKTRGLGRLKLEGTRIIEQSLCGFAILDTVLGKGEELSVAQLLESTTIVPSATPLEIKVHWEPVLPVMVKAGYDGIGVDMLPLTSGVNPANVALVLPGSSIKGALRSHAERIVRTRQNIDCAGKAFNDQLDVPLVNELFGARNKSQQEQGPAPNPRLGLGALSIDDCYTLQPLEATQWRNIEQAKVDNEQSASDWELSKKLQTLTNHKFQIAHHVAIDRWTGGASEGALFSVLEPHGVAWEPMTLTLDLARYDDENERLKGVMLLLLTLRDVAENRLPFGFGGNRGLGEIKVTKIEGLDQLPALLEATGEFGAEMKDNKLTFVGATDAGSVKAKLKGAWGE